MITQTCSTAVALLLLLPPAFAQEDPFTLLSNNAQNAKSFQLDLNTPTSPGFVVIGASPNKVSQPGSLQELVIDNAGFVENGSLKPGLAINFQPFWLFGNEVTLEQYAGKNWGGDPVPGGFGPMKRALARTQLSFASVKGENAKATTGARLGAGFHTQLLDGSDPRDLESAKCIVDAWQETDQPTLDSATLEIKNQIDAEKEKNPGVDEEALLKKVSERVFNEFKTPEYDKAYKNCLTAAEQRFLQARSWMVGAGVAASSASGNLDDLSYAGTSFWTTFKQPFGLNKSIMLFSQADFDRRFATGAGTILTGNSYHAAVSLAIEELAWKLDATASYHFSDATSASFTDDYLQVALNGAFKLRDGIWLEGSLGTRTGSTTQNDSFGLVQLKFDLSNAAQNFLNN